MLDIKRKSGTAALGICLTMLFAGAAFSQAKEIWRKDWPSFRVGIVASGDNLEAFHKRIEPFRAGMEAAIGVPVRIIPVANGKELVKAHARLRIHYAVYTAAAYATAWIGCECVYAIAAPLAADGSIGFHALILGKPESEMSRLKDLKGLRVAFGQPGSVAGDLVPIAALRREGLAAGADYEVLRTRGPKKAVAALASGKADAAVGWSSLTGSKTKGYSRGTLKMLGMRGDENDRFSVVWASGKIPHGPHAVHRVVPDRLRELLTGFLTGLADKKPKGYMAVESHYTGGFAAVEHGAYTVLIEALALKPNE